MKRTMYQEEVYERSQLARQSKYRKGKGGRAIHTRLPSDNMTTAQLTKKNGPVLTYDFGKPMTWEDFKLLDDRHKAEYLNVMIKKHGGTAQCIAAMFDVHSTTIRNYARTLQVKFISKHGKEEKKRWEKFLKKGEPAKAAEPQKEEQAAEPAAEPVAEPAAEAAAETVQASVADNGFVVTPPAEPQKAQPMDAEIASLLADMAEQRSDDSVVKNPTAPAPAAPVADAICEMPGTAYPVASVVIPSGTVTLQGSASACLEKIAQLLGDDKSYAITVQWTVQA